MMDHSPIICEKCGNQMEVFREGRTQGIRCTHCDWSVVTTYTPPIQLDRTIYDVRVERGDYRNPEQVKAIAHVMGGNFLTAREAAKNSQSLVLSSDAQHVMQVRDSLLAAGVVVIIRPEFPW
jgi:DNA-directed RNA polymerase subunit RPC12/RpoP